MRQLHSVAAVLVVLAAVVGMGSSLKCHQCTSFIHSQCADPFVYEAKEGKEAVPKTKDFLKDCPNDGNNYTLCRKIYQNVRGDERIIRSCGWEPYKKECYKTVLEEYNTYVCQCEGDGCNGASFAAASVLGLVASVLAARIL